MRLVVFDGDRPTAIDNFNETSQCTFLLPYLKVRMARDRELQYLLAQGRRQRLQKKAAQLEP